MLVLTRKVGEKIRIGTDIELMVVRIDGGAVRLGIVAPREIPVTRTVPGESKPPESASLSGS